MKEYPRTREGQIEKYARHCVHFNGVQNKTCKAGIEYASARSAEGFVCFGEVTGCGHYEAAGMDATRKRFAEMDEYSEKIESCFRAIKEKHGSKRGLQDSMPCPVCKTGTLRYSIAGINGHVHGHCSTENCVSWMQ